MWLFYGYTLFNSTTWMLCITLTFYECFVDVTGKHTARIGRSDRLVTGKMSLKVTFLWTAVKSVMSHASA